jgi:hypothetical protein
MFSKTTNRKGRRWERFSAWTLVFALLAGTLWLGNWMAMHLENQHERFYLLILVAFLGSAIVRPGSRSTP